MIEARDTAPSSPFKILWLVEILLPLVLQNKDGYMQNNSTSHKSCRVHPYSPLLCWYFCSRVSDTIEDEFFTASTSTSSSEFPVGRLGSMDWTSSLCFRPLRPFVKFAILNSIICLLLFDVCGQWPLLVIFWFFAQLWACYNKFCVVGSLLCYRFSLCTLLRLG